MMDLRMPGPPNPPYFCYNLYLLHFLSLVPSTKVVGVVNSSVFCSMVGRSCVLCSWSLGSAGGDLGEDAF